MPQSAAAGWKDLILRKSGDVLYSTTSEFVNRLDTTTSFSSSNLFDGDEKTCWKTSEDGKGEKIYFSVTEDTEKIFIINGFAKSTSLFSGHSRVKKFKTYLLIGISSGHETNSSFETVKTLNYKKSKSVKLNDTLDIQSVNFPFNWKTIKYFSKNALNKFKKENIKKLKIRPEKLRAKYILCLEIIDVYSGAESRNACVSELWYGENETPAVIPQNKDVKIYINEKRDTVLLDTAHEKGVLLEQNSDYIFEILEISKDRNWFIVLRIPSSITDVNIKTDYSLYHTKLRKKVPGEMIGEGAGEFYGFEGEGDSTCLLYANNDTQKDEKINLLKIYNALKKR